MELKAKEICDIIKVASKAGVLKLDLAGIKLEFGKNRNDVPPPPPSNASQVVPATPEQIESISDEANVDAQLSQAEDDLAELLLTDPEKYEELLADGELEDGEQQSEPAEEEV